MKIQKPHRERNCCQVDRGIMGKGPRYAAKATWQQFTEYPQYQERVIPHPFLLPARTGLGRAQYKSLGKGMPEWREHPSRRAFPRTEYSIRKCKCPSKEPGLIIKLFWDIFQNAWHNFFNNFLFFSLIRLHSIISRSMDRSYFTRSYIILRSMVHITCEHSIILRSMNPISREHSIILRSMARSLRSLRFTSA